MAIDIPKIVLLIFVLLFLFFSPDSRSLSFSQQRELSDQVLLEKHDLSVISNSSYSDLNAAEGRWLNLTGLRKNDNFTWHWLPKVQERARTQSQIILDGIPLVDGALNASHPSDQTSSPATSLKSLDGSSQLYQNCSGIVRGQWSQSKLGKAHNAGPLNLTSLTSGHPYVSHEYKRNITGSSGDLRIQMKETEHDDIVSELGFVRAIKAEMLIKDESSSGDGWQLTMFGVHYPREGGMIFSTTSEKFAGIFALPHFALSERGFLLARNLLNQTLKTVIDKQTDNSDSILNPWTSSPNNPSDAIFSAAQCEYIVYLQQYPIEKSDLRLPDIEQELRFPTGVNFQLTPRMKFSALIFSPDCGFVLESKGPPDFSPQEGAHLEGPKIEIYMTLAKRAVFCLAIVVSAQVFLLKRQMQDTSTPSTLSRISLYTVTIMAVGDGLAFIGCLGIGLEIDSLFLPLIATGFAFLFCAQFLGMKFIMDIWTVQAPERQEREREEQRRRDERNAAAAPLTAPVITPAESDTLPLPVTARRAPNNTATQVILPPDQDLDAAAAEDADLTDGAAAVPTTITSARQEIGSIYTKLFCLLLSILFLSIHATTWPIPLRTAYCNILAFIYFSMWTPQIYRNIMRNCRKAFRWEFIIGQSLLRLLPFSYFYLYTPNVLYITTSPPAFYALTAWVWLQFWVLVSQEILGPRFFVKEGWAPPAYDYHPLLRPDDSGNEAGSLLPIGFSDSLRTTETSPISPTTPFSPSSAGGPEGVDPPPTSPTLTRQNTTGASTLKTKATNKKDNSSNKRIFDCAICTEDIVVPVLASTTTTTTPNASASTTTPTTEPALTDTAALIFERRKYMVTPCRHIFHSGCLEGWMRYRLQCPICRENLPPL